MQSTTPMSASLANMLLQLKDDKNNKVIMKKNISKEHIVNNNNLNRQHSVSTNASMESADKDTCHCRKSKCLKLYCQCFATMAFCSAACRCIQCENTDKHMDNRSVAIQLILERNPSAFDSKFKPTRPSQDEEREDSNLYHKTGCRCRKSMCLKKYCECYQGGIKCNATCTCLYCCNSVMPRANQDYSIFAEDQTGRGPLDYIVNSQTNSVIKAAQNLGILRENTTDQISSSSPSTSEEDNTVFGMSPSNLAGSAQSMPFLSPIVSTKCPTRPTLGNVSDVSYSNVNSTSIECKEVGSKPCFTSTKSKSNENLEQNSKRKSSFDDHFDVGLIEEKDFDVQLKKSKVDELPLSQYESLHAKAESKTSVIVVSESPHMSDGHIMTRSVASPTTASVASALSLLSGFQ